jgi:hypothetical protein
VLQDACPTCGGEIADVTHTRLGQQFLSIIAVPEEIRTSKLDKVQVYATGPSSLFSVHVGDES